MLRFYLKELISEYSFQRGGKQLTQQELADATGIKRTTISRIQSQYGYVTTTKNVDLLCEFFGCEVEDLVKRVKKMDETE